MKKRFLMLLVLICVLALSLAACVPEIDDGDGKKVYRTWTGDVTSFNPHQTQNPTYFLNVGSFVAFMADKDGKNELVFVPQHASELPKTTDGGKTWTIKLRNDIEWNDGSKIDANTYEYSIKQLLNKNLANKAIATMWTGTTVVKAKDYFEGNATWEEVGIKVVDQYTMTVTLSNPVDDVAFYTNFASKTFPVHKELYEAGMTADKKSTTYGTTLDTVASAGMFKLTKWVSGQYDEFEVDKKDALVKAGYIKLDVFNRTYSTNLSVLTKLFLKDELDTTTLASDNYATYKSDPRAVKMPAISTYGMWVNSASVNTVMANQNLRKALMYAAPRKEVAEDVYKAYAQAHVLYPEANLIGNVTDGLKSVRSTDKAKENVAKFTTDTAKAVEFFNKAYAELGNKKITVNLLYQSGNAEFERSAVVAQDTYKKLFGEDKFVLTLTTDTATNMDGKFKRGEYDMGITIFQGNNFNLFNSALGIRRLLPKELNANKFTTGFDNKEFTDLYLKCTTGEWANNSAEKLKAVAQMEHDILDYVVYIPLYSGNNTRLYSERIILPTNVALPQIECAEFQFDIDLKIK